MKIIYPLFCSCVLLVVSRIGLLAQEPIQSADKTLLVQAASKKLGSYFEGLGGFEFTVDQETVVHGTGERFTEKLSYAGQGISYWFDYSDNPSNNPCEVAFNGDYGQLLNTDIGRLELHKSVRLSDFAAVDTMGLLQPFAFFGASKFNGGKAVPHLPTQDALSNVRQWMETLDEGTTIQKLTRNGVSVLCISMPGGVMPGRTFQTDYKVFIDPNLGFYPVAWERDAKTGSNREVYNITEFATARTNTGVEFKYPKSATREIYYGDGPPYCTTTINVSAVKAGEKYDQDKFTIDPASVRIIYDADEKRFIRVPK